MDRVARVVGSRNHTGCTLFSAGQLKGAWLSFIRFVQYTGEVGREVFFAVQYFLDQIPVADEVKARLADSRQRRGLAQSRVHGVRLIDDRIGEYLCVPVRVAWCSHG